MTEDILDRARLTDRVYERLREGILTNRLTPGTSLQESTLARSLGVSRGPVREALQRLAADGLVNVIPRRGAVVTSLSPEEFLDAYRVREALEVLAVRLAAPRLRDEDLQRLEEMHRGMLEHAERDDVDGFLSLNAEFHTFFARRADNETLLDMYRSLRDQMRRYRLRSVGLRGGLKRSCEEHRALLDAVRRGEVEEACWLMSEHIRVPQRILESSEGRRELQLAQAGGDRHSSETI